MGDGVGQQFAQDAQDRMRGRVVKGQAGELERDGTFHVLRERTEGDLDRTGEVRFVQGIVPEVVEAAAEFGAARAEHPVGGVEGPGVV